MPFRSHGTQSNDNGAFLSISDCTPGQERLAVMSVFRDGSVEDRAQVLEVLGLTGTAEGMLAARDAQGVEPQVR